MALALAGLAALAGCAEETVPRAEPPDETPNLLVVMTDDQALGAFSEEVMPRAHRFFADGGTRFEQAIAAPPLCCPSRAGFLTGRYAHNHGVVENERGYGDLRDEEATLAVALRRAGYATGMTGKFLNGYEPARGAEPAPGFEDWFAAYGPANYTGFNVSDDGEVRAVEGYSTTAYTDHAIEFTREARMDDRPFFLWLAYNAPHSVPPGNDGPCSGEDAQPPSPGAFEEFAGTPLPQGPSFDEADVSDKPSLAGGPPRLGARKLRDAQRSWRCALAASRAVDDQLARLLDALRDAGELERTVVAYLSDNGYYYGEHRLTDDKRLPFEPALRIPFAVRAGSELAQGDAEPPAVADELVSQADLAPTMLEYAGVEPCGGDPCATMDGRSLRPLIEGSEKWPEDRAIPLTLDEGWTYSALRTPGALYAEYSSSRWREFSPGNPAVELYDLAADPHQLENAAAREPHRVAELAARLDALERCSGIEGRDGPTPGRPFCE